MQKTRMRFAILLCRFRQLATPLFLIKFEKKLMICARFLIRLMMTFVLYFNFSRQTVIPAVQAHRLTLQWPLHQLDVRWSKKQQRQLFNRCIFSNVTNSMQTNSVEFIDFGEAKNDLSECTMPSKRNRKKPVDSLLKNKNRINWMIFPMKFVRCFRADTFKISHRSRSML